MRKPVRYTLCRCIWATCFFMGHMFKNWWCWPELRWSFGHWTSKAHHQTLRAQLNVVVSTCLRHGQRLVPVPGKKFKNFLSSHYYSAPYGKGVICRGQLKEYCDIWSNFIAHFIAHCTYCPIYIPGYKSFDKYYFFFANTIALLNNTGLNCVDTYTCTWGFFQYIHWKKFFEICDYLKKLSDKPHNLEV